MKTVCVAESGTEDGCCGVVIGIRKTVAPEMDNLVLTKPALRVNRCDIFETHLRPAAASGGRQRSVFTHPNRTIDTNSGYSGNDSITAMVEEIPPAEEPPMVSYRVVMACHSR
jgi:hypothetical protein